MNRKFWRAEVYKHPHPAEHNILKLFAGIYLSRQKAQDAAQRLCSREKGFGFYIHQVTL